MGFLSPHFEMLLQDPQHRRILRLSFPRNDGPAAALLPNRLDAREGVSRDFEYVVEVLSDDARIPLKRLLGRMVTIELVRGDGSVRYFNGYVFEFKFVKTDGGFAFYRMVLRPWMAYLKLRRDNFVFHEKTLLGQTELVFADYRTHADWNSQVGGDDPSTTMACQFGETDHNYLHRRWEAAGWHYWYEHCATGHKLVLADDSTAAMPIDGMAPQIRFQKHGGSIEEEAIHTWSPARQIVAGQSVMTGFDFKHPVPATVDVPTMVDQGDVLHVETYDYAGAYGFRSWSDGNAKTELRMEELEARCKHFDAEGNNRFVQPGRWFALADHFASDVWAGDDEKAKFLVLEVEHSAANNYLQGKHAAPDYRNVVTCTRRSARWRPGRDFNSQPTRMPGPQTAIVVGPSDREIHTDQHGRVRVQFHWDRHGNHDDCSSAFVRVASSWASGQYGAVSLPRVGDEVIVDWLEGNPDLPIITGRVYNGSNPTPWELPSQGALSGIRSRELKGAAGAGTRNNHLLMDDTHGQIQAVLSSDHYHSQLSLGYLTRVNDRQGRRDYRGEGYELRTDGWGALRAAKGLLVTTWKQSITDEGTTQQDNMEGADTLRAVLDSAANRSKAAEMASDARGERKHAHRGLESHSELHEHSWSLSKPIVFITAPDGVATSTPQSIVQAAGADLGNHAAGYLDLTAGKILSMSAAQGLHQHVERGGHSSVISHGDYHVHVQDGKTELVSQKGITIEARTGDITLKTKGGSIVLTEAGDILLKGAKETHEIAGAIELGAAKVVNSGSVPTPESRPFWGQMNIGKFSQQVILDEALHKFGDKAAHYAYKIVSKDGAVLAAGKLDTEGKTERVFTENMEELHVEVDMHDSKWGIVEHHTHSLDVPLDLPIGDAIADLATPVGIAVIAEKVPMSMDMARTLFMDDGKINVGSVALSIFESRLKLPARAIVELVRRKDDVRIGAIKDAVVDAVHERVNFVSARLLAALHGHTTSELPVPHDIQEIFEQAQARRARALEEATAAVAGEEITREIDDALAVLSRLERPAIDLEQLPADLRASVDTL